MQAEYAKRIMDEKEIYNAAYAQGYNEAYVEIEKAEERERARAVRKQRIRERKKQILLYYIKQKLTGITIAILGILSIIPERDITAAVLMVPLGLWLMFTKEKAILQ